MMPKRDRLQSRLRGIFAPSATRPSSVPARPVALPPAQPTSSPPGPAASHGGVLASATSRDPLLEKALARIVKELPETEKAAFAQASKTINEHTLLSAVRAYDVAHKDDSSFRPHAEHLSKFLEFLNRFMGGVAIGIQASPEISALVVGAVRLVIDLALNFTTFFSRLTDLICTFEDYLGPLAEYAQAADIGLVEKTVVNAYANILTFGWKARRVFVDANGKQRKWTSVRVFMRQHWETFESEYVSIKEDLQHHLGVLLHSVQALHFNASREAEQARRREEERKEKSAFLSWVSSIDFEKTHQDTFAKKHAGTCDWLMQEPKYQQWFSSSVSSLLWCHGKPGIGKSVLASNVIEDISTRVGLREDTAICFAYYNYRNTQLSDISQIVAALIKQLCRKKDHIPHDLLQLKHDALSPSLVGTQDRFVSLVEDQRQVYVVFDALDECLEAERETILGFITGIVTAPSPCNVKVFVTSRKEMDIAKAFEDKHIPTIQVLAENVAKDIETFTRSEVEKLRVGEHGKTLYVTSDKLIEKIVQTLTMKAEGMFLWVRLQLDNLCQASKARKDQVVQDALETLPRGLPDTYVRILEQIEDQPPYMRDLALNCLAWVIYARRPLSTCELQCALAIKASCTVLDELQPDSPQVILEACANLLEEANETIRPIHYTVQEFLTTAVQGLSQQSIRTQLLDSKSVHARLSFACLTYMHLVAFSRPVEAAYDLYDRLETNALAGYANQNFDYHILRCDEVPVYVMGQLERLFQQESRYLAAILQIKVLRGGHNYRTVVRHFDPMRFSVSASTIIYSTSLYNVPHIRKQWAGETTPKYALQFAASAGLAGAIIRLLDEGYNVNERDGNGITSLYHACFNDDLEIIQMLLDKGADVNAQGGYFGNALQAASCGGHEATVKLLLDKNADVNAQGGDYGNALQAASWRGDEVIVKLLLEEGANINAQGGHFGNALQAASFRGNEAVAKLLLEEGANVNAQGGQYGNALHAASYGGDEAVVKLLLEEGADVNAQGGHFGNALQVALFRGNEAVAKLLLEEGANINAQGGHYGNALQAASFRGNEAVAKLLLEEDANVNAQGGYFGNALQAASCGGHEAVVKLLFEEGASINAQGGEYGNALQAASYRGHETVVKLLVEEGANVNAQGGYFGNALQAASCGGHEAVVKLLLEEGADSHLEERPVPVPD